MIPTLLLVGLVLGKWWRIVIPAAVVGWVAVLLATRVDSGLEFVLGAAALAFVNVTIGVLLFQALWLGVRWVAGSRR
jgi:hypothetical protein